MKSSQPLRPEAPYARIARCNRCLACCELRGGCLSAGSAPAVHHEVSFGCTPFGRFRNLGDPTRADALLLFARCGATIAVSKLEPATATPSGGYGSAVVSAGGAESISASHLHGAAWHLTLRSADASLPCLTAAMGVALARVKDVGAQVLSQVRKADTQGSCFGARALMP